MSPVIEKRMLQVINNAIIPLVAIGAAFIWGHSDGYEEGQVDALHGKWSYRLKTNQVELVERVKE